MRTNSSKEKSNTGSFLFIWNYNYFLLNSCSNHDFITFVWSEQQCNGYECWVSCYHPVLDAFIPPSQPSLIIASGLSGWSKEQSSAMTFKIITGFGNMLEHLSVAFWPHTQADICVHATLSTHYANKFLEPWSGWIAVERSREFVFTCLTLLWSQSRFWGQIEISQTGVWLYRRPVRAGPGSGALEVRGGGVQHIWNQHVCLQEEGRGGGVKGSARVSFQSAVLLTTSDRYFIPSKLPHLKA